MVDPFASTNPADASQQQQVASSSNPSSSDAHDVFGGALDVFADPQAVGLDPIDPVTGEVMMHGHESIDPFLRDENKNPISSDFALDSSDAMGSIQGVEGFVVEDNSPSVTDEVSLEEEAFSSQEFVEEDPVVVDEEHSSSTIDEVFHEETDASAQKDSYFATTPSFETQEESRAEVPNEKQEDTAIESAGLQDGIVEDKPISLDTTPDAEANISSDHYDPFVDSVADVSVYDPVVTDDPFLAEPLVEDINKEESLGQESVEDNSLQEDLDSSSQGISYEDKVSDDMEEQSAETSDETLDASVSEVESDEIPSADGVSSDIDPELESIDPFLSISEQVVDQSDTISTMDTNDNEAKEDIENYDDITTVQDSDVLIDQSSAVSEGVSTEDEKSDDDLIVQNNDVSTEDMQLESEEHIVAASQEVTADEETIVAEESSEYSQEQGDVIAASEPEEPSMLQGLVEGMLDPFASSPSTIQDTVAEDGQDSAVSAEKVSSEAPSSDDIVQESIPDVTEEVVPVVASVSEDANEKGVHEDENEKDQDSVSEPTVNEDEQNMQKSGLSDILVKFQELLQAIYRVHDARGGHDPFIVVGADNDALYITYSFAIEASAEQEIMITKESTDRKDGDAIDTHVLRFAVNSNSLVEVYVDGVLLFVEDQLVDNVKAKMQLMDKFNKFIFLINQFIQDSANQASGDAIASAQEEFGGF